MPFIVHVLSPFMRKLYKLKRHTLNKRKFNAFSGSFKKKEIIHLFTVF